MLDLSALNLHLTEQQSPFADRVIWFDHIGSTNDYVLGLDDFHASICIAGLQTAGRGRRGRQWQAPFASSVLMSIGWRISQQEVSGLSLAVGLAVRKSLVELGVSGALLKWPNDVLVNHHKIAGILLELAEDKCVIGVGLNVNIGERAEADQDLSQIPAATALPWSDLNQQGYDIEYNRLVMALIVELGKTLNRFEQAGFAPMVAAWNDADAYFGKEVTMVGRERIDGKVLGVMPDGAIRIETAHGAKTFHSGEVSLRPQTITR